MVDHSCLHEEQLAGQSRKIAELESASKYKDKNIDELKATMKELDHKFDELNTTINNYIISSKEDDGALKDYINKLENRVTSLESSRKTTYQLIGVVSVVLVIVEFALKYVRA